MILAFADDLTGALETAAKFADFGFRAVTTMGARPVSEDTDVLVIDTETRHVSSEEAAARVRQAALASPGDGLDLIYKKTDSTLRGNVSAELAALADVYPERGIVYGPAYPAMGRTVADGHLLVHGTPVHETEFARDPLNPIGNSRVRDLFHERMPIEIHDGQSDADVEVTAHAILRGQPTPIAAGPAALAGQLAALLARGPRIVPQWPELRTCLVVNGSLHPQSLRQIERARKAAWEPAWRILTCPSEATCAPLEMAHRTGRIVADLHRTTPLDGLIIFGGDTAAAIVEALGNPLLHALGEIVPGVPVSRADGLWLITKAGGFGNDDLLLDLHRRLRARN
jgi:uncharacterized protein YgbK (DUF1537 family)